MKGVNVLTSCRNVNIRSLNANFVGLEAFLWCDELKLTQSVSEKHASKRNDKPKFTNFLVIIVSFRVIEVGELEAALSYC